MIKTLPKNGWNSLVNVANSGKFEILGLLKSLGLFAEALVACFLLTKFVVARYLASVARIYSS